MRQIKIVSTLLMLISLSACHVFLGPEPDTSPNAVLYSLWSDFDKIHAYLDIRLPNPHSNYISWDDVYYNEAIGYKKQLQNIHPNEINNRLFGLCADMLRELDDPHVSLRTPHIPWFFIEGRGSLYEESIKDNLAGGGSDQCANFLYGTFNLYPHIGYIYIKSFSPPLSQAGNSMDWAGRINDIILLLNNSRAIVLDIRCNGGGDPWAMQYIADRFASKAKDYIKERVKSGPGHHDFSAPQTRIIKPAGTRYTKPIVLLTNGDSVSAAEWFTLALRTQDHVTHAGTKTRGAFSPRVERPMINGWSYRISPYRVTDMNDICYEGIGISPDKLIEEKSLIQPSYDYDSTQLELAAGLADELAQ
jgi:hypothetical protein